jgi:predicted  nucleic acid-binding Zn-ribbon protein
MNQAFHLARLQKIDTQIDQFSLRLKEIERLLNENALVQEAERNLKEADLALKKAGQQLRIAEDAVNAQRIKIETNESSLYAGKIHNPKELQDLQNDIASLKRYLATLEDQQLEAMMAHEEAEANVSQKSAALSKVQGEFISKSADLTGEKTKLND